MIDLIKRLEEVEVGSRELSDESLLALPNGFGLTLPQIRRFLCRVITGPNCWSWDGPTDANGRSKFYPAKDIKLFNHRVMWALLNGPIPDGKLICHRCDVPGCLNPKHIYCGTHADNSRDSVERGRTVWAQYPEMMREAVTRGGLKNTWTRGAGSSTAKLTEDQARAIRASKERTKVLTEQYDLTRSAIQKIRRGATWKYI